MHTKSSIPDLIFSDRDIRLIANGDQLTEFGMWRTV